MKYHLLLLPVLLLMLSVPVRAVEDAADESAPEETLSVETQADDRNITVNIIFPATTPAPMPEYPEINVVNDVFPAYSMSALDDFPEPSSTLSETVTALFGTYTPRTQTVVQRLEDGTEITYQEVLPGLAGLDWPWLASVGLFALFLFSLLRLIGGLLKL